MGYKQTKVVIYPGAFDRIINTSPRADALVKSKAEAVIKAAIGIFDAQQKLGNELDLSENSPPRYRQSFRLQKTRRKARLAWQAVNVDPGWNLVEYGAHAGGKTFVLRYRPLGRGLDAVASFSR